MPNFAAETGMTDEAWERVRVAMCEINLRQQSIKRLVQEIGEQTDELSRVLWPRTDPNSSSREGGLQKPCTCPPGGGCTERCDRDSK